MIGCRIDFVNGNDKGTTGCGDLKRARKGREYQHNVTKGLAIEGSYPVIERLSMSKSSIGLHISHSKS